MLSIFKESLIDFRLSSVLASLALTTTLNSLFFFTVPLFTTAVNVIFSSLFVLLTTPAFERILLLLDLHSISTLFFSSLVGNFILSTTELRLPSNFKSFSEISTSSSSVNSLALTVTTKSFVSLASPFDKVAVKVITASPSVAFGLVTLPVLFTIFTLVDFQAISTPFSPLIGKFKSPITLFKSPKSNLTFSF